MVPKRVNSRVLLPLDAFKNGEFKKYFAQFCRKGVSAEDQDLAVDEVLERYGRNQDIVDYYTAQNHELASKLLDTLMQPRFKELRAKLEYSIDETGDINIKHRGRLIVAFSYLAETDPVNRPVVEGEAERSGIGTKPFHGFSMYLFTKYLKNTKDPVGIKLRALMLERCLLERRLRIQIRGARRKYMDVEIEDIVEQERASRAFTPASELARR